MKKAAVIILCALCATGILLAQDFKGNGRLLGIVLDEQGKPIPDVTIKLYSVDFKGGFTVKSESDGKWIGAWLRAGTWNLDFEKPGYVPFRTSAAVLELTRTPEMKVVLKKMEGLALTNELKNMLVAANTLFEQNNYAGALDGYNQILAKYPEAYIIWKNIGNCYFAEEQYDKAEEAYKKVLEKKADDADALQAIGNCYFNRNQQDTALEYYGKIQFEKIDDPAVLFNIGLNYFKASKLDDALKYFKRSTEVQKDFEDGYYQLGLTYVAMNQKSEAIAVFEQFLRLFPESPKFDQVKGFLEYLKK